MRSGIARRGTVCERAKKISMRGALRGASGAPAAPSMPAPASSSLLLALGRRRRRANRRRQRRRRGVRRGRGVRTRLADDPPARPGGAHPLHCRCGALKGGRNCAPMFLVGPWPDFSGGPESRFLQCQNPTPDWRRPASAALRFIHAAPQCGVGTRLLRHHARHVSARRRNGVVMSEAVLTDARLRRLHLREASRGAALGPRVPPRR